MQRTILRVVLVLLVVASLSSLIGCAGMEYAPKEPSILWYYPTQLPEADRAVEAARKAGKDKECPDEFNAANAMKEEAYRLYWACRDKEAIDKAMEATKKAQALCPMKAVAPAPTPPPPPPPPAAKPEPAPAPAPAPAPKKIVLEDVHFDFDKATLTNEAKAILARDVATLKENSGINVQIEGHTCAHGAEDYNMALGERRANAVKEFLVKEGVDAGRLSTISYGETRLAMPETPTPKNKNSTEAKANRRVHFEVIMK